MSEPNTQQPIEPGTQEDLVNPEDLLPHHWLDEYVGQWVTVQLKRPYFLITNPGCPAMQETNSGVEHIRVTVTAGVFSLKKDQMGNVRALLTMKDPDPEKQVPIRVDLDPVLLDIVTVCPMPVQQQQEKPRIVMP